MASNTKKTYFLSPSFDWPAENGPVKLGAIIVKRDQPQRRICSANFKLPTEADDVYESEKIEWEDERWKKRRWFATFWVKFLQGIGVVKIGANGDLSNADVIKCDRLTTKEFVPTKSYMEERMRDPEVQTYLKKNRIKAYMITGIKVAYNPTACHTDGREVGAELRAGLNLAPAGAPASVGGEVGGNSSAGAIVRQKGGTNIVYAYQLMRIDYRITDAGAVELRTEEETRGTYMNVDSRLESRTNDNRVVDQSFVEFSKLVDAEITGDNFEVIKHCVDEISGEDCEGVRLKSDTGLSLMD